ncbi:MAG: ribosome biogenesis GTPase YlqF [Bacillota bacterium]
MSVHWYPGHMAKTKRLIREQLRLCDLVFELADARIPQSSRNPVLNELTAHKPRILILTKPDLADPTRTGEWLEVFGTQGIPALKFNAVRGGESGIRTVMRTVRDLLKSPAGNRPRAYRAVTVGIPNVGKSSFINRLTGQRAAQTGKAPGITRGKQWIRVSRWMELLDTPGTLWPKLGSPAVGFKLAATGAIREEVFSREEVAGWLISWLQQNCPRALRQRYGLPAVPGDTADVLEVVGRKRGLLLPGGKVDHDKTAAVVLKEFREGALGRFTLDIPGEGRDDDG